MLAILIFSASFLLLVSNAKINDMVAAEQQATEPQNFALPFFNIENKGVPNDLPLIPSQAATTPQNAANCPNTAILFNILNILTNSLPTNQKSMLEPEKFKYVLTVVKNFLETTPLNPDNVQLYNKFKNLEALVNRVNGLEKDGLQELGDKLKVKNPLKYDFPAQSNSDCKDIFNNLVNFINTIYSQVLRYCLTNEKCNNRNTFPFISGGVYPNGQIQRNLTNSLPIYETLPKESLTASADLVNFIKNQRGTGVRDIMSILQNYRPTGVTNLPGNGLQNLNSIQNPFINVNPGIFQAPSVYRPINEINGKNLNVQPNNIYKLPNIVPWQTIFSKEKGTSGDPYKTGPTGVTNIPGNNLQNPNSIQNPVLNVNSGSIEAPILYQPANEINGKNLNVQPSNIYKLPNTVSWQTIFSREKIMSGDPNKTGPTAVTNISGNDLQNPNSIQNPLLNVNPGNIHAPGIYRTINEINGNNLNVQPNNIYKIPNTVPWQMLFSGQKVMSGDPYKTQQNVKYLSKQLYGGNNIGAPNSIIYSGLENPNEMVKAYPSFYKNPNSLMDLLKQTPNQQQNLLNTNIKIQSGMAGPTNKLLNFVDSTGLPNMYQYLKNLPNIKVQSNLPQNILYQNSILPQQSKYITPGLNQYPANQPTLQVNNQLLNQNGLSYNQISPSISYYNAKYNNGQNMFPDNAKQGNYSGQLLDLNHLLGVANSDKLNAIPHKNGVVELTYMLKRPKPVYEPQYYVKYRLPYETFLYNLQNLLVKKPSLRNEQNQLYELLLVGSNVTDTSKDLKALNYKDILKLTSTNGTLVTAKILESNDTVVDETLKIVQKLNSKLPVENIINLNLNSTNNIRLETQKNINSSSNSSDVNNILSPAPADLHRRGIYPNDPYSTLGQNPSRLQVNPYSVYQTKPSGYLGIPFLKYGTPFTNTNSVKNPVMKPPYYIANNLQFG